MEENEDLFKNGIYKEFIGSNISNEHQNIISNMGKEIYYNLSQKIEQTNNNILKLEDKLNYNSAQNNNILTKISSTLDNLNNKFENLDKRYNIIHDNYNNIYLLGL